MRLIIANGKIVEADPAAEAWLREVIALRKTIKQQMNPLSITSGLLHAIQP